MVVRLFCILFFISNLVKSQDYPILSLDTNGTKLVIFTEPQAQKIDRYMPKHVPNHPPKPKNKF